MVSWTGKPIKIKSNTEGKNKISAQLKNQLYQHMPYREGRQGETFGWQPVGAVGTTASLG